VERQQFGAEWLLARARLRGGHGLVRSERLGIDGWLHGGERLGIDGRLTGDERLDGREGLVGGERLFADRIG
jgi:hypothetical protein